VPPADPAPSLLLRNAEIGWADGDAADRGGAESGGRLRADLRISRGTVTEVAPALSRRGGEAVYDCHGGAVLPGLCDHHVHLHAMAARAGSARCGPPDVTGPAALADTLAAAEPDASGWIRGTGYTESVAGDLDAPALDKLRADLPVRIQHRSGALWILNTAALTAIGAIAPGAIHARASAPGASLHPGASALGASLHPGVSALGASLHPGVERDADGRPAGRLWRADAWLRSRLPATPPPDLTQVGAALLGHGITAVTDATPDLDAPAIAAISEAMARGVLPPCVCLLGAPLGAPLPGDQGSPGPTSGPYKIVLADSELPPYDELTDLIRTAHAASRPVAAHCVTREALVLLVAALGNAGPRPGDRIEHAALVPPELLPDLARLGVRVVTQPGFLADRGDDFLRDVPPADRPDLYRCAALLRAGIPVALSSDAPFGPLDPWAVIAAATSRRTPSGQVAGAGERITFTRALDAYLAPPQDPGGPPRRVSPGLPADLVVLRAPLAEAAGLPDPVRAVLTGGTIAIEKE
jgi:predicted amidohydrolase YtcJ